MVPTAAQPRPPPGAAPSGGSAAVAGTSGAAGSQAGGGLPDLRGLSTAELQELLTDDRAFKRLLAGVINNTQVRVVADGGGGCSGDLPVCHIGHSPPPLSPTHILLPAACLSACLRPVSQSAKTLCDIGARNRGLAGRNLEMEGALGEAKNQAAIVKGSEYDTHKATLDELAARQAAMLAALDPGLLLAKVSAALEDMDAEATRLMDSLYSKKMSAEGFADKYSSLRARYHALDLKRQALQHGASS